MALGVPGRLSPRIFSIFCTTRVVGRQPNALAAFTPGEIPGTHFQRLSPPQRIIEWLYVYENRKVRMYEKYQRRVLRFVVVVFVVDDDDDKSSK